MTVISIEPSEYPGVVFRIYVECAAESSDVRLDGRGVPYVSFDDIFLSAVDNSLPGSTEADDRTEDPIFRAMLKRRSRGRHVSRKD